MPNICIPMFYLKEISPEMVENDEGKQVMVLKRPLFRFRQLPKAINPPQTFMFGCFRHIFLACILLHVDQYIHMIYSSPPTCVI